MLGLISLPNALPAAEAFNTKKRRAAFDEAGALTICRLVRSGHDALVKREEDNGVAAMATSIISMFCADAVLASKLVGSLADLLGIIAMDQIPPLSATVLDALDAAIAIARSSPAALHSARACGMASALCSALVRVVRELPRDIVAADAVHDRSRRTCASALELVGLLVRLGGAPALDERSVGALVAAASELCADDELRWASIEALHAWAMGMTPSDPPPAAVARALRCGALGGALRRWIGAVLRVAHVAPRHIDACAEIAVALLDGFPRADATGDEAQRFALVFTNAVSVELRLLLDGAEQLHERRRAAASTVASGVVSAVDSVEWRVKNVAPTYFRALELVLLSLCASDEYEGGGGRAVEWTRRRYPSCPPEAPCRRLSSHR